ncbi:MAG: hypothetical protein ACREBG_22265 [Pyrinomonadaceae bacterium]
MNQRVEVVYGETKPTGGKVLSTGTGKDEKYVGVKDFVVTITIDLNKIDGRPAGDATPTGTEVFKHEVVGHGQDFARNPVEATFESQQDSEDHANQNVKNFQNDKRKSDMKEADAEREVRQMLGLPPKEEKKKND